MAASLFPAVSKSPLDFFKSSSRILSFIAWSSALSEFAIMCSLKIFYFKSLHFSSKFAREKIILKSSAARSAIEKSLLKNSLLKILFNVCIIKTLLFCLVLSTKTVLECFLNFIQLFLFRREPFCRRKPLCSFLLADFSGWKVVFQKARKR